MKKLLGNSVVSPIMVVHPRTPRLNHPLPPHRSLQLSISQFPLILRDAVRYVIKRIGEILGFDLIVMPRLNIRSIFMLIRVGIVLQCFILRSSIAKFLVYHISHNYNILLMFFPMFSDIVSQKYIQKKFKFKKKGIFFILCCFFLCQRE